MLTYHLATAADAEDVVELRKAAARELTHRYGPGHWSETLASAPVRGQVAESRIYRVELEGVLVATFELRRRRPHWYGKDWFAEPDAPALYLFRMAVSPRCQRQGVGREVMHEIDRLARREAFRAVRLDAHDSPAGAGGFYRKCGYGLVHSGSFNGVALEYYERRLCRS